MKKTVFFCIVYILCLSLYSCGASGDMVSKFEPSYGFETAYEPEAGCEDGEKGKKEYEKVVLELLEDMTLEEKVGQIFLARCPTRGAEEDIKKYHLGGYILFGRDFENKTPETVIEMTSSYQEAAEIPLLLAVDEEGGEVCRVSNNPELRIWEFPSPRDLFKIGGMDRIIQDETEKSQLLKSLGLNVNMAPVCDITTDKKAFMYERSLGQNETVTAEFVSNTVNINNTNKVGCVLKHFPGYGNNKDTHKSIAVDERLLSEFESKDLIPFTEGIKNNAPAVLFSHTVVKCFDDIYPVSLSPDTHKYIREKMGFEGVIVTDDLVMDAIKKQYGTEEAAVLAVLAGNDLLCSSEYAKQYAAVLDGVINGRIPIEMLDEAVLRVLQWKCDLGLLK